MIHKGELQFTTKYVIYMGSYSVSHNPRKHQRLQEMTIFESYATGIHCAGVCIPKLFALHTN